MKKRNGWKWMLALTILFAMGFIANLTSPMYDDFVRWPVSAAMTAVMAGITFWMRSRARKAEAEEAKRQRDVMEAVRKDREDRAEKLRRFHGRYPPERFAVAGVTFKKDENTDRQHILREIVLNENGSCDVWFEEETEGEHPGIRVLTDCGCVGYIRRSDKEKFRRFVDNTVTKVSLETELFENDEGEKIYRADVVFVLDRESPLQKWYFDDLPES